MFRSIQNANRQPYTLMDFAHPNGVGDFVPEHMYVRYRKDRRVVVLLNKERTHYRVYLVPQVETEPSMEESVKDLGLDDWAEFAA